MGLLASLTGESGTGASDSASEPSYASNGSTASSSPVSNAVSGSDARRGKRTLVPVTELKSSRSTAAADCTQLSYEKAIQLHRRQRRNTEIDDFAGNIPPVQMPSSAALPGSVGISKREALVESSKIEVTQSKRHEIDISQKVGAREPTVRQKRTQSRTKASPGLSKDAMKAAGAAYRPTPPTQHAQTQEAKRSDLPRKPAAIRAKRPNAKATASTASASNNKTSFKPKQCPESGRNPAARLSSSNRPGVGCATGQLNRSVAAYDRTLLAANAMDDIDVNLHKEGAPRSSLVLKKNASMDQRDQRRTILSVRLTGEELEKLKDRADESGISVSAYMRLCVLDADQLRAQVKQVLAEVRALHREPEPHRLPAIAGTSQPRESNGATWFHVALRSAAFLLSPLFPFRRSA